MRIRRETYKDCEIMASSEPMADPRTRTTIARHLASYLIHCDGKTVHSGAVNEMFDTASEAEDKAFESARSWVDAHWPPKG